MAQERGIPSTTVRLLRLLLVPLLCAVLWRSVQALPIGVAERALRSPNAPRSSPRESGSGDSGWWWVEEALEHLAPCGQHCLCNPQATYAKCSQKDLTSVPLDIPVTVQHLDLRGNNIRTLHGQSFNSLTQLRSVDISSNNLQEISTIAFQNILQITALNLANNILNTSQLDFLQLVPSVTTLSLSGNSLGHDGLQRLANYSLQSVERLNVSNCDIEELSVSILDGLPSLQHLVLDNNQLESIVIAPNSTVTAPDLLSLSLSNNHVSSIDCQLFNFVITNLEKLDISHNNISYLDDNCFSELTSLTSLSLSGNSLTMVPTGLLANLTHIIELHLNNMSGLSFLQPGTFDSQVELEVLDLSFCPKLSYVHAAVFSLLQSVRSLNLNHSGLTTLHRNTFHDLKSLKELWLGGIKWHCDCDLLGFQLWLSSTDVQVHPATPVCTNPSELAGRLLLSLPSLNFSCAEARILNHTEFSYYKIGDSAVLDCIVDGDPRPNVTWLTNKKEVLTYLPAFLDYSLLDPMDIKFHDEHPWHNSNKYSHHGRYHDQRITVLQNGSLYIDYVTRGDGGPFTCIASNPFGNDSIVINMTLNYDIISETTVISIILGFVSAFGFFLIAVLIAIIRYVAFFCSSAERKKRKSIRQILSQIQEYKCTRFDRLRDYKTAKIEKLSSIKRQKMDKLVAFRTARIDKLRTYKQATVTSMIHHLETMRMHYQGQMTKVKDNCTQQVEKLRESYTSQMGRLKDYKSQHVEKVRDNYNNQLLKIREYSSNQMIKLRDQYKLQQQHAIKLLELLDVGNCLTVIEAECMRTESMLFDPNISFDLEAQPVHLARVRHESEGESDYRTPDMVSLNEENAAALDAAKKGAKDGEEGDVIIQDEAGNNAESTCSVPTTSATSPTKSYHSPHKNPGKHRRRRKHRHSSRTAESENNKDEDDDGKDESRNQTPRHHKPSSKRSKERSGRQVLELPLLTAAAAALTIPMGEMEQPKERRRKHCSGCASHKEIPTISPTVHNAINPISVVEIETRRPAGGDSTEFESAVQSREGSPTPSSTMPLSSPQSLTTQSIDSTMAIIASDDSLSVVTVDPSQHGSLAQSPTNESAV